MQQNFASQQWESIKSVLQVVSKLLVFMISFLEGLARFTGELTLQSLRCVMYSVLFKPSSQEIELERSTCL